MARYLERIKYFVKFTRQSCIRILYNCYIQSNAIQVSISVTITSPKSEDRFFSLLLLVNYVSHYFLKNVLCPGRHPDCQYPLPRPPEKQQLHPTVTITQLSITR